MKILIMRFSSFGDVLQTLSVAGKLGEAFPSAEIHWVTREEFTPLIETHPHVQRVWSLKRGANWQQLWQLGTELNRQKFTHVYDAHNNLRSRVLGWRLQGCLGWLRFTGRVKFLRRSIYRWKRHLLFKWRINLFPQPFTGQFALLEPLQKWGLQPTPPAVPQLLLPPISNSEHRAILEKGGFVALAPSASHPLKRWPLQNWIQLIEAMPSTQFVVLGGPEDQFSHVLSEVAPQRVLNLAGRLDLAASAQVIQSAAVLVSNDTGLLHVAEQIGKPCLALMGPAPFGFPGRPLTEILQVDLPCRPCSKHGQGPCINAVFHRCLRDITTRQVLAQLRRILDAHVAASLSSR